MEKEDTLKKIINLVLVCLMAACACGTLFADIITLRSMANNMYVCADSAGAPALIANRTAIGTWEKFTINGSTSATPTLVPTNPSTNTSTPARTNAPTPTSPASNTNLALNRSTSSFSNESSSFASNYAVDGNTGTRWSSAFRDPQWITVDLGASYYISRIVLRWETAFARTYEIQVSGNNSTWTTVYSTSSIHTTGGS
ncbi:MAG: discoidin domain-containing protein [Spirochaetales bacterium]|nr:discoidin domain-containing protein [Spirochaetales bacterium]